MSLLVARDVIKSFGAIQALRGVSIDVRAGTIHGIVGPNGAGKSTFLKILTGQHRRDGGTIEIAGRAVGDLTPRSAGRRGLAIVPQETTLPEELSVAETIVLGREPAASGMLVGRRKTSQAAERCLREMGISLPLDAPVSSLSAPARRLVMFAQVVHRRSQVIIVDEPTAGLDERDAQVVVRELLKLKSPSRAIVFVSHRLNEVVELCDRVTAIRDGRDTALLERDEISTDTLADLILGANAHHYAERARRDRSSRDVVVAVKNLHGRHLRGADLEARQGEILGLAGLVESGVEELASLLAGERRPRHGVISIAGRRRTMRSPADAVRHGVAYLPEDRSRAVLADTPVRSNIAMPRWPAVARWGLVTARLERRFVREVLERLSLVPHQDKELGALSGGNRQKVLIGRAVASGAKVLVVGNPTAGVDVKGRGEIHGLLDQLAHDGLTIILSSTEPEEIAGLSDRVVVFSRGRVVSEIAGDEISVDRLMRAVQ